MGKYASNVVKLAKSWIGKNEKDGSHKEIIDIYNSQKALPQGLPRGHKMSYSEPWCAATMSAIAVALGYTDIIPTECSCNKLIELAKKMGIWVEDESVTPEPAWFVVYDWDDSGKGDNTGRADHVGVIETVINGEITAIEGNYKNAVGRRPLEVNGKYIRGYIAPKYDTEDKPAEKNELEVDGKWGKATTTRLQEIFGTIVDGEVSNQWAKYRDENPGLRSGWEWEEKPNGKGSKLIKAMQKWAGMPKSEQDGEAGPDTFTAIQKKLGTKQDGHVSNPSQMVKALQAWANLLGNT